MKLRLLGAALAACFAVACSNAPAGGGNSANGSLGISRDDALIYAADSDLDTVFVVDAKTEEKLGEVKVGRQPEKVLVAPDDTVFVTNRMDRSVSVIRKGELTESARIEVGVEPVGLAISSDSKTLYVVNSTARTDVEFGTLMAIDTASRQPKWEIPVGREPRGITLMGDGKAAITLYKEGDVVLVDLQAKQVVKQGTEVFQQLNRAALGIDTTNVNVGAPRPLPDIGFGGPATSRPRGLEAITTSADGQQLFVASLLSSDKVLATSTPGTPVGQPVDPTSSGYAGGTCGSGSVAAPALLTFDQEVRPQVDDLTTCGFGGVDGSDRPPMLLTSNVPGMAVQGPRAMTLDPTGSFVFVVNFDSNNVAIVPTANRPTTSTFGGGATDGLPAPDRSKFGVGGSVTQLVDVGAGPTGVVVSRDGKRAWVYAAFDHKLVRLEAVNGRISNVGGKQLGKDVLSPEAAAGRRLFFSASDARMNNPSTGISCGTCHLEGREDGHVWNFPDGPRQTPSLSGRMLEKTAPFHWNGEFQDLMAFMTHTVTRRMGGSGVTPAMEQQVAAFLASTTPADNPLKDSTPADVVARGRSVFEKAACNSCHSGEAFTDNKFADVGTFVKSGTVLDNQQLLPHGGLNNPSLLNVARTAPYLHDGSAATLKARILQGKNGNQHGLTAQLSDAEVDDLVAYLKTL